MPDTSKLEKLNRELEKSEKKLRKAINDEKALQHQLKQLTRKERTHRLCTRGGMLESFLQEPEREFLLRTQTSGGQIRTMDVQKPPIKILMPGRVFRSDSDATHSPMFHQMEGLVVDKGITLGDLQGALNTFVQKLFGADTRTRLRPSYFPFTEPSVEVDVSCFECHGKGCPLCKHTGWIEVLGGGVVNRKVLENCNIDPDEYSGFAFGIGIERIAMLKYGINNIGLMFENNLQFLKQFHE